MVIREAVAADIDAIVDLLETKRVELESWEPRFWKKAPNSADLSKAFLGSMIDDLNSTILVADVEGKIVGCIQFKPTFVPPVYTPGGTTWMIDDFVVCDGNWEETGSALLKELRSRTINKGDGQLVFPVPAEDTMANSFFVKNGLSATTTWWTEQSNSRS